MKRAPTPSMSPAAGWLPAALASDLAAIEAALASGAQDAALEHAAHALAQLERAAAERGLVRVERALRRGARAILQPPSPGAPAKDAAALVAQGAEDVRAGRAPTAWKAALALAGGDRAMTRRLARRISARLDGSGPQWFSARRDSG